MLTQILIISTILLSQCAVDNIVVQRNQIYDDFVTRCLEKYDELFKKLEYNSNVVYETTIAKLNQLYPKGECEFTYYYEDHRGSNEEIKFTVNELAEVLSALKEKKQCIYSSILFSKQNFEGLKQSFDSWYAEVYKSLINGNSKSFETVESLIQKCKSTIESISYCTSIFENKLTKINEFFKNQNSITSKSQISQLLQNFVHFIVIEMLYDCFFVQEGTTDAKAYNKNLTFNEKSDLYLKNKFWKKIIDALKKNKSTSIDLYN